MVENAGESKPLEVHLQPFRANKPTAPLKLPRLVWGFI